MTTTRHHAVIALIEQCAAATPTTAIMAPTATAHASHQAAATISWLLCQLESIEKALDMEVPAHERVAMARRSVRFALQYGPTTLTV